MGEGEGGRERERAVISMTCALCRQELFLICR